MTKLLALVLSASFFACTAEQSENASPEQSSPAPNAGGAIANSGASCPTESAGPPKTVGLLDKCEGAYLCKMSSADEGHEMHLHSDGTRCFAREAGLGDYELRPDGTIGGEDHTGTWSGDAVGWEYTTIYNDNGRPWSYSCAPIAPK